MIAVVGLGFVGLTTALGLAKQTGRLVYAYDSNDSLREQLCRGEVPFHEPELGAALLELLGSGLIIGETLEAAVRHADIVFYCVGTPSRPDGGANLDALTAAIVETLPLLKEGGRRTLVIKSTVPPMTTTGVVKPLLESSGHIVGDTVGLAHNPEFLREGRAWQDFIHPDRIVIGACDKLSEEQLKRLYEPFGAPMQGVSPATAEFAKLASNALLATMISFSNELAELAEVTPEIDIPQAFRLLHADGRWQGGGMAGYVYPGCGFGGYCLPKDALSLQHYSREIGRESALIGEVLAVNARAKLAFAKRVAAAAGSHGRLAVLGLAFKPGSDDVRGTPAADIIAHLLELGLTDIVAYDPLAMPRFREAYDFPIRYAGTLREALDGRDSAALVTAWPEFSCQQELLERVKVIDGRYGLGKREAARV
ncbi:nucleotide sugar dehydrogenase [Paenibacillus sp. HB172176]|uniref:nucleotide sugar dehydrogenase n=1 Tax=Paenibacillus sp. HB172176 TaxID=2493690 RepID=UPI0014392CE1|nr:nucleotide sugar dehydrogenase [Paenibacillus sp. HB172176]